MKNQLKFGVIISGLNTFLNMFINIFFTPFLISSLGDAEYVVYIMTFGMAALVTRNIVYFNEKKQQKEKENFLAMAIIVSVVISIVTFFVGMVMYKYTGKVFKNSLSQEEIVTAKKLVY